MFTKEMRLAFLGILALAGLVLAYFELRRTFSPAWQVLLPVLYVALILTLLRAGILPASAAAQPFSGRFRTIEFAKSLGCMLAAFLWVAIAVRVVSDTPTGVTLLAVPLLLLLGASGFFFFRGFTNRSNPS